MLNPTFIQGAQLSAFYCQASKRVVQSGGWLLVITAQNSSARFDSQTKSYIWIPEINLPDTNGSDTNHCIFTTDSPSLTALPFL